MLYFALIILFGDLRIFFIFNYKPFSIVQYFSKNDFELPQTINAY